jgi:hypothetical protein
LLTVRDLWLLRTVFDSKLRLAVPFLVHSVGYGTQARIQSTNKTTFHRLSSRKE